MPLRSPARTAPRATDLSLDARTLGDQLLSAVLTPGTEPRGRRLLASSAPAVLLGVAWAVAYLGGGSHTALPHLFYVPILLSALTMGFRGGALAGLVAALLCGPLLPLVVETGQQQPTANWLARGGFFVLIGATAGAGVQAIRDRYDEAIERTLRTELHTSGLDQPNRVSPITAGEVRQLIDARAFHVVFQPIRRLDDGHLLGVEALTRFHGEPYRPPDAWFAHAARAGLGVELELATAEAAFHAATDGLASELTLNLNVSPAALTDERLVALLRCHPGRPVVFEVTEHAVVEDYQQLELAMAQLRQLGARLAVDDAGAGFSSLRHIVRLSPEIIKLDLSLTQGLGTDPVRAALADCLVGFARRTGTLLVAEGIEQESDLQVWRDLGADAVQGYLLGRPGPLTAAYGRSA